MNATDRLAILYRRRAAEDLIRQLDHVRLLAECGLATQRDRRGLVEAQQAYDTASYRHQTGGD